MRGWNESTREEFIAKQAAELDQLRVKVAELEKACESGYDAWHRASDEVERLQAMVGRVKGLTKWKSDWVSHEQLRAVLQPEQ